jgi:NhaP-type Na+/H+ or K+/H+ antiporter
MTFGVVASSIVVQGATLQPLVHWLGRRRRREEAYERLKAEQLATAGARAELHRLRERNLITAAVRDELQGEPDARLEKVEIGIAASQRASPAVSDEERRIARLRLALAERSVLERAVDDGVVSEHAARPTLKLATEPIDAARTDATG